VKEGSVAGGLLFMRQTDPGQPPPRADLPGFYPAVYPALYGAWTASLGPALEVPAGTLDAHSKIGVQLPCRLAKNEYCRKNNGLIRLGSAAGLNERTYRGHVGGERSTIRLHRFALCVACSQEDSTKAIRERVPARSIPFGLCYQTPGTSRLLRPMYRA